MTKFFNSINQYFATEPHVSVETRMLSGVMVSLLDESSNDISVASTAKDSVLVSLSGSDFHRVRIGDRFREAPTLVHDVALVPAGVELHSAWCVSQSALRTLSLEFDNSLFATFAPELGDAAFRRGSLCPANYGPRADLSSIAMIFLRELDGTTRHGPIYTDTAARLLALQLAATTWSVKSPAPTAPARDDRRMRRAVDFIEARFREEVSLVSIAEAAGLSVTALTAHFRRHTGHTPYSYVIERRVRHAVELLQTTDLPIAQVALEAGFADQQHMTRIIGARRGQTPRTVRRGA